MQLRFAHEGTEYEYDSTLSLVEAMLIKECTGLTAGQFLQGLELMDGAALGGMVLICKMRAGENTTWTDLLSMDLVELVKSIGELTRKAAEDAADEQDSADAEPQPAESAAPAQLVHVASDPPPSAA